MDQNSKKHKYNWILWMLFGLILIGKLDTINAYHKGRLMVPLSYSAFTTDLRVQVLWDKGQQQHPQQQQTNTLTQDLRLQLSRIDDMSRVLISIFDIYPDPRSNITQITLPCQNFLRGGFYELEIIGNDINSTLDERLKQQLDVRWPTPKLSVTPESIGTYPQEPLNAILEFPGVECLLPNNDISPDIPEFWLELLYCGHDVYCDSANVTKSQILYSEQVRGYPRTRIVQLRCDLFGLAGHYVFKLKPTGTTPAGVSASAYIKADWSEQFVFNVHARSIFPCDPHSGIAVLFEYPACILDKGDRVRLFAKLRADVASLAPPTSLHYVTEQRVIRDQHSLFFDCELFSEKYVEYCFVYVSQAITGAVADVRMDCVPTLPVKDSDTGGWGPWSSWTPCSTTCAGGTKNRYRFCDSPPPRYGAKFCEGSAVETGRCGGPISGTWECIYGSSSFITGEVPADRPEIIAEIGLGCRCGCIVHLGIAKPRRLVASSSHSCPGRSFWLIQADDGHKIRFKLDFFRLPCLTQSLKIRDGDSLAAELIGQYYGGNGKYPDAIISSSSQILLEFFSNELASMGQSCGGGFLAHAQQIQENITIPNSSKAVMAVSIAPIALKLTMFHIFAILFISIFIVISILLGAQYAFRYRKYQLAESIGEPDSPARTPRVSVTSYPDVGPPSRAISTTTLISEIISLVKLRPRVHQRMKHSRLRESVDIETLDKTENDNDDMDNKSQSDGDLSIGSTSTLKNENQNNFDTNSIRKNQQQHHHQKHTKNPDSLSLESGSPRSINSISLPPTPVDTPLPLRKMPTQKNTIRSDTKSLNGKTTRTNNKLLRDVSPVREEDDTENDTDSTAGRITDKRLKMLSVSNVTLTNACYSPASSMISTATIRSNNQKESKEKQNRERLLAGPGSEFSLTNPEELELDYYDYNVTNAGAAPGSYLGMDPAYLVWIPPIDEGNIMNEIEHDREHHYEEILPRCNSVDPGSNTETPDDEDVPELPIKQLTNQMNLNSRNIAAITLKCDSPFNERRSKYSSDITTTNYEGIQLQEYPCKTNSIKFSPAKIHRRNKIDKEKETAVIKSPTDNINDYYELDDIKFADDDNEILEDDVKNTNDNKKKVTQSKFYIKT